MKKITLLLVVFLVTGFAYANYEFLNENPISDEASLNLNKGEQPSNYNECEDYLGKITDSASNRSSENRVVGAGIPGETCENAITIASLPYTTSDNTSNYGNNYAGSAGTGCGDNGNFLSGDDVVYAYTAIANTTLKVTMTPMVAWTGIFVYTDCADIGTACVAGAANSSTAPRTFDLSVTNGTTYYFLISSYAPPQSIQYTLNIKDTNCTAATANFKVVDDCDNSGGFLIDVNVTAMGSATNLTISDDFGSAPKTLSGVGTVQFGPYGNGTDVVITVDDDNDNGSCTVTSPSLTQTICPGLSLKDDAFTEVFTYSPNPVTHTLYVNAKNSINLLSVYNMLGQEVIRTVPNALSSEVDMSPLNNGTYFVKVTINGAGKTIRVIKQ